MVGNIETHTNNLPDASIPAKLYLNDINSPIKQKLKFIHWIIKFESPLISEVDVQTRTETPGGALSPQKNLISITKLFMFVKYGCCFTYFSRLAFPEEKLYLGLCVQTMLKNFL